MGRKKKRLEAMQPNPLDWTIDDLVRTATDHDFDVREGGKGSHVVFTSPTGRTQTIPAHRPIKPIYVKFLLEMLDELPTPEDTE